MTFIRAPLFRFERPHNARQRCSVKGNSSPILLKATNGDSSRAQIPQNEAGPEVNQRLSSEEMVRRDLEILKARKAAMGDSESRPNVMQTAKDIVSGVLLWDFFLVVALLAWLLVALVPHFTSQNDFLLDPWLRLWGPFIQPVLGVLMLGTIVQGTISFLSENNNP